MSQLATLQRIVQRVSKSPDLKTALQIIVDKVKAAMQSDACSVFLRSADKSGLTLKATDGLDESLVNQLQIDMDQGLVGLVAQRAEPVNVSDATKHPSFQLFEHSGDQEYHAFLGVPIVDHRRLYGVLIVQAKDTRVFSRDDTAFLVTLGAQLAWAISAAELAGEITSNSDEQHDDVNIDGLPGAPGVAIGTAVVHYAKAILSEVPNRKHQDAAAEKSRLDAAIAHVKEDMATLKTRMGDSVSGETSVLFDAYSMMLDSETLLNKIGEGIDDGNWAQGALRKAIDDYSQVFADMEDEYLSERVVDIRDMGRRILAHLSVSDSEAEEMSYPEKTILVGHDLSATQLAEVPRERLVGLICTTGTQSSHLAILARSLGVPTVMGASSIPLNQLDGVELAVDGYAGRICIKPSSEVRDSYTLLIQQEFELSERLRAIALQPAISTDGVTMPMFINSGLMSDLSKEQRNYCDGLGLYRTELPFMLRDSFPTEDEQEEIYRRVMNSYPDQPVTLRTLDVGGDKPLKYFPIEEANPFLGWRGVRITLDHPEIFLTQLRAMLRASVATKNLNILLPMISTMSELDESLALIAMARAELAENGLNIPVPKIGVMIEVPSAVYIADQLAAKVDFLSIGSNDLIQYLMAVDRNNSKVASLYSDLHPPFLMALQEIVEKSHRVGKPVSLCGEMASDPVVVLLLLGMELDSLSVSMASLPSVKWVINHFSQSEARELVSQALSMQDPRLIRKMLSERLVEAGLGALVRAG